MAGPVALATQETEVKGSPEFGEVEAAVSPDHATTLQPGPQSEACFKERKQRKNKKEIVGRDETFTKRDELRSLRK